MSATSQNGYTANDRSLITSVPAPGGNLAVRKGDVATVLQYVAGQFHAKVEPLVWPGCWGYAERTIRGSSTDLSNHASGTAIDLNAPQHPLGATGTFSANEVQAIRGILVFCDGVVRWGGDYSKRKDEMHFEIVKGLAEVARIAEKIRGVPPAKGGTVGVPPKDTTLSIWCVNYAAQGNPISGECLGDARQVMSIAGHFDPAVAKNTQPAWAHYAETGDWERAGDLLFYAVRIIQSHGGLVQDGIFGPQTAAFLHSQGSWNVKKA